MTDRQRRDTDWSRDLSIEARLSTLEQQYRESATWRTETTEKIDEIHNAIIMAKGGWLATAKLLSVVGLVLGAFGTIGGFIWWAIAHVIVKP